MRHKITFAATLLMAMAIGAAHASTPPTPAAQAHAHTLVAQFVQHPTHCGNLLGGNNGGDGVTPGYSSAVNGVLTAYDAMKINPIGMLTELCHQAQVANQASPTANAKVQ